MTQRKRMFNLFSVSEARNVIFGLATLWIGLFHSTHMTLGYFTDIEVLKKAFRIIRVSGNAGVDMFLFLSGVGLFFSFHKDGRVLKFWKKRLMRVLPTALFIAIFYFSIRYVNGHLEGGTMTYISRITFTYFFITGERVFWFISLILVLYLLFPVFYKVIERFRWLGMAGLIVLTLAVTFIVRAAAPDVYVNIEIALCRIPVFIVGIWCGRFVMEKREIPKWWLLVFLALAVGALVVMQRFTPIVKLFVSGYNKEMEPMYIFLYRYAGSVLGVSLVMLSAYVITAIRRRGWCSVLRNFFEFVGMYSMEYYMIYLNINNYLARVHHVDGSQWVMLYFGSFVFSLALCALVKKFCDFFMDYMRRKPKKTE